MDYKISHEKPPVFEKAHAKWGVSWDTTIFTYGDTIHSKNDLPDDLLVHELVHVKQQTQMGKDEWWNLYFEDSNFRLEQELKAYCAQYRWFLDNRGREDRRWAIRKMAIALGSQMYGHIVTRKQAKQLIMDNA